MAFLSCFHFLVGRSDRDGQDRTCRRGSRVNGLDTSARRCVLFPRRVAKAFQWVIARHGAWRTVWAQSLEYAHDPSLLGSDVLGAVGSGIQWVTFRLPQPLIGFQYHRLNP